MNILFDICIPVGPNEKNNIENMISYTKKNIISYRNLYLISYDPNIKFDGCITIDEKIFPFNKDSIANYLGNNDRNGWYLQQLLKLYAVFVIPDISSNILIIDADTYFLKPTGFFKNGLPLYNFGSEYHSPYFNHMNKLHHSLTKKLNVSGICHHMVLQKDILNDLFILVESYHKQDFWKVFLESIDKNEILGSGASEYEIYFNYLNIYHKDKLIIRQLKWTNSSSLIENQDLDYVSCHWYMK